MKSKMNEAIAHLFDEQVHLTGVIEYGISWSDLIAGKVMIPPQGARFDISFEGTLKGEQINGQIRGVDFLEVRADGRFMLNIQATILTNDGESIALHEDGVLTPQQDTGKADLFLNMKFACHSEKYNWLNKTNAWAYGQVEMAKGEVVVSAYSDSRVTEPILN